MSAPRLVSIREFARLDGCNDKLVRRALDQGKLRFSEGQKLDAALAGSGWRKQNRRAAGSADKRPAAADMSAPPPRRGPAKPPSADEVEAATDELFSEEAEDFLNKVLAGEFAATGTAERVKENALAAKHLLAARRAAGNLVEIETAEQVLFETQRSQRDAWVNFPTRIGPLLAAELEVEADKVVEALTVYVHQQLDDLGDPEADFRGKDEG
jgi:hypothetical protein